MRIRPSTASCSFGHKESCAGRAIPPGRWIGRLRSRRRSRRACAASRLVTPRSRRTPTRLWASPHRGDHVARPGGDDLHPRVFLREFPDASNPRPPLHHPRQTIPARISTPAVIHYRPATVHTAIHFPRKDHTWTHTAWNSHSPGAATCHSGGISPSSVLRS